MGVAGSGAVERASAVITISDPHGLHARPTARLVQALAGTDAKIEFEAKGRRVPPCPFLFARVVALAQLGLRCGETFTVKARGRDAHRAVDAIRCTLAAPPPPSEGVVDWYGSKGPRTSAPCYPNASPWKDSPWRSSPWT
jgi:phosphotransferase system HPr (HPr) family protein